MGLLRHGSPAANRLLHSGFCKPCSAPRASGRPAARKGPTHSHGPCAKRPRVGGERALWAAVISFFLLPSSFFCPLSSSLPSRRPWQESIVACETKPNRSGIRYPGCRFRSLGCKYEEAHHAAPSTVRPLARDPRVLIGWPLPLGFGLGGRLLLARRGQVYV